VVSRSAGRRSVVEVGRSGVGVIGGRRSVGGGESDKSRYKNRTTIFAMRTMKLRIIAGLGNTRIVLAGVVNSAEAG